MKRLPLIVAALALMIATLFCLPQADACDQFQRFVVQSQQQFLSYGPQQVIVPQRYVVTPVQQFGFVDQGNTVIEINQGRRRPLLEALTGNRRKVVKIVNPRQQRGVTKIIFE